MPERDLSRLERLVLLIDNLSADGAVLIVNIVFWWAYASPTDSTIVTINEYGEKLVEIPLLLAWSAVVVWGSWIKLRPYAKRVWASLSG